jgi:hypothetical protein
MRARDEGERVVVELSVNEVDTYIKPLTLLAEAQARYRARVTDLGTADLRPYTEAYAAAEDDVRYALSETLDVRQAEYLCRQLEKAILRAKVARGDFAYEDLDA